MSKLLGLLQEAEMWDTHKVDGYHQRIREVQANLKEQYWVPVFELALDSIRGLYLNIQYEIQNPNNLPTDTINKIFKADFDLGGAYDYFHGFLDELGKPSQYPDDLEPLLTQQDIL